MTREELLLKLSYECLSETRIAEVITEAGFVLVPVDGVITSIRAAERRRCAAIVRELKVPSITSGNKHRNRVLETAAETVEIQLVNLLVQVWCMEDEG